MQRCTTRQQACEQHKGLSMVCSSKNALRRLHPLQTDLGTLWTRSTRPTTRLAFQHSPAASVATFISYV